MMSKLKIIFWVLIAALIAVVFYQNEDFCLNTAQSMRIHLYVFPEYTSPQLPAAVFLLAFFLFGMLVAWLFGLAARLRLRRGIRQLEQARTAQEKEIASLREEIAGLKGGPPPYGSAETEESSFTAPLKPA